MSGHPPDIKARAADQEQAEEARRRAQRREEWARLGELEHLAEQAAGGGILGEPVMVHVREAVQIGREQIVAAELGWLEVERQDDPERA